MSGSLTPPRTRLRRRADDLYLLEEMTRRRGFVRIAGVDEAGRGACAGPLVIASVVLPAGARGRVPGLADSKLLSPAARERVFGEVMSRAVAHEVVIVQAADVDAYGVGAANIAGMRRAVARLWPPPDYVLTDGFGVDGLSAPGLGVQKGDRVAACVSAAGIVAKVTRDRIMVDLDARHPGYGFEEHKGYGTEAHMEALRRSGPCAQHRRSYANVAAVVGGGRHALQASMPHDG